MKKLTKILLALTLVFCALFAVACTPTKVGDAVEKLAEEGYIIAVSDESGLGIVDDMLEDADGDFTVIVATKKSEFLYAVYFEKSSDAKDLFEEYQEDIEDYTDYLDDIVIKRESSVIIVASEDAWEDFSK